MIRKRSNLITLALATIIVLTGMLLPNMIYPMLDPFMEQITLLEVSGEGDTGIVFSGPPSLYPLDLYSTSDKRQLETEELHQLRTMGITDFLLGLMADRGMPIEGFEQQYGERLLTAFEYMSPQNDKDPPCFFIYACDIDADNVPDLHCAVNTQGRVIMFLVLNDQWSEIKVSALVDLNEPVIDQNNQGSPEEAPLGAINGMNDANNNQNDQAEAVGEPDNNTDGTGNAGEAGGGTVDLPIDLLPGDRVPISEHYAIWSVSYSLIHQKAFAGQEFLTDSFNLIDLNFSYNYRYSFDTLVRAQSGLLPNTEESLPDSSYSLSPQIYTYDTYNYVLYVYDLAYNTRIIFYIDSHSLDCVGFIIQEL
jgi:hypothetical protein